MWRLLLVAFLTLNHSTWSQDLSVPDDILNELETVVVETETDTFVFRVAYPDNYDADKEYSCFLGLSGGGQSLEIVNYCYAAWFRSGYFNKHITILPINHDTVNFRDYDSLRIELLLDAIQENFPVKPEYLIAGTSNGGVAAFNFVAEFPKRFEGLIVAPGTLNENLTPTADWAHLKVILAYGSLDDSAWIKASKATAKRIKKSVSSIELISLSGQGHILSISFNADKMYDPYFIPSK